MVNADRARRSDIAAFLAMDVMEAARQVESSGVEVARLEVGQPGAPAPRLAREAVIKAMQDGAPLGYTVALGLPALRERLAQMYAEVHGLDIAPERIVVTTGSSAGFILAFLALFEAGSRMALADPGYPSYRNILHALDIAPVRLEATLEGGYQPSPALLAEARGTGALDGLLVASPANPTGTALSRSAYQALIEDCAAQGTALISDEIYDRLWYAEPPVSALSLTDDVVVINSFSKYYCMTGWRIGWMVVPEAMIRPIERLAQNLYICPPHIAQAAALAALDAEEELQGHMETYRRNRALLLDALPKLGFRDFAPADGAFYLYGRTDGLAEDSREFAKRMLHEAHVAAVPGVDFDPVRGASTMRFSFAGSERNVELAVERLDKWLRHAV